MFSPGFSLQKVAPCIWHLSFNNSYDLTMHFFRYQEYYDSAEMSGKNVQFVDLLESYTSGIGNGTFSYINDWVGFNLPAKHLFDRHREGISDKNRCDDLMLSIFSYIKSKEGSEDFYVIGTSGGDPVKDLTFKHELAHGLFFSNPEYKGVMISEVENLPKSVRNRVFRVLEKWGYDESIWVDEAQAYLATGLQDELDTPSVRKCTKPFERVFNKFYRDAVE